MKTLRIATRKSTLAMWQARHVQTLLESRHPDLQVELVPIVTQGDRILDRPLALIGGKGLFLKELERALLDGQADIAVHSMKDVPAEMPDGLVLDVVLERASPFDALICHSAASLDDLPAGSVVGTSSLRRQSQLLAHRPDLKVADLRGNVDTRLQKLRVHEYDAIILAHAGLQRLGREDEITELLKPPVFLPASTQGIIGIQYRKDDAASKACITPLNDPDALIRATAERAVARHLEGSCQLPLAVYSTLDDANVPGLSIHARVGMPDGTDVISDALSGAPEHADELGIALAEQLLQSGAGEIISRLA